MDTGIAGGARALLLVGDTAKISGAGAPPTDAAKSATVPVTGVLTPSKK